MLVLSRHEQEVIMIGDKIVVKVLRIEGDRVSIGVQAPKDVAIARKETIVERLAAAKEEIGEP